MCSEQAEGCWQSGHTITGHRSERAQELRQWTQWTLGLGRINPTQVSQAQLQEQQRTLCCNKGICRYFEWTGQMRRSSSQSENSCFRNPGQLKQLDWQLLLVTNDRLPGKSVFSLTVCFLSCSGREYKYTKHTYKVNVFHFGNNEKICPVEYILCLCTLMKSKWYNENIFE